MAARVGRVSMYAAPLFLTAATDLAASTIDPGALWNRTAHLQQVGEIDWRSAPGGNASEQAGWFVARNGVWYAFNRVTLPVPVASCPTDHTDVVVRQSRDRGKTWSAPASAIEPGDSGAGDGCAVLDGASYYDRPARTWHILAQCLARGNVGGWSLCHYIREDTSPIGRFTADRANPIVRGGGLWSRICAGAKACPSTTVDEGTPDILERRAGRFVVTFHGYDYASKHGYRGVATTPDFRRWSVVGGNLPGDAVLGPADCRAWLRDCAGVGEATMLLTLTHIYAVAETMTKSLSCATDQRWVFQLLRRPRAPWSASGTGSWTRLPGDPLLSPSKYDPNTICQLQYARWLQDGTDLYLIYEDAEPGRAIIHRRVLKLVPGGGPPVRINQ